MAPPSTIVFRRPRRSPIHKLESAPKRHPISWGQGETHLVLPYGIRPSHTHVDRDYETLEGRMVGPSTDYDLRKYPFKLRRISVSSNEMRAIDINTWFAVNSADMTP